jgi:hypothetical protein
MSVDVELSAAAVSVRFRGLDRLWAFSRGLRIPVERITAAATVPRTEAKDHCPKLRVLGSFFPGRLHCGRYGLGARQQLWCVHRADEVLALDLSGRPFARVVIEVARPADIAAQIGAMRAS